MRLALIGAGRIGQVHARNIAGNPACELRWVCDFAKDVAVGTTGRYGGMATSDVAEIFSDPDVDGVVIASPTPTHLGLTVQCVTAGKAVLCEKPIDLDIHRVDGHRAQIVASGQPVMIGFNRRFDPSFAELRRRLLAGEIGTLEHLIITSRDPQPPPVEYIATSGGIFRDMTIHDLDLTRYFVTDVSAVTAHTANHFDPGIANLGDFDAAVVNLRGVGGELVTIVNSRHSPSGYDQRVEALGSEGSFAVTNATQTLLRRSDATTSDAREPYLAFFLERYAEAYRAELQAFVTMIITGRSVAPTFDDGRAALLLADAAAESAATGRTVTL